MEASLIGLLKSMIECYYPLFHAHWHKRDLRVFLWFKMFPRHDRVNKITFLIFYYPQKRLKRIRNYASSAEMIIHHLWEKYSQYICIYGVSTCISTKYLTSMHNTCNVSKCLQYRQNNVYKRTFSVWKTVKMNGKYLHIE